ncbi:hypothetical protein ACFQY4_29605 [Catellatospora bangladeshensis]
MLAAAGSMTARRRRKP